jgi:hypothetical protein
MSTIAAMTHAIDYRRPQAWVAHLAGRRQGGTADAAVRVPEQVEKMSIEPPRADLPKDPGGALAFGGIL